MFGKAIELTKVLNGILYGRGDISFDGVSTDTRKILPGQLFVAIKGLRHDGHNFIGDALKAGASGVISAVEVALPSNRSFLIKVPDTREALGRLASYWRRKVNPKVIGVTGSCGKTTTKELIYSVVSTKDKTLKNHANYNNFFGLTQTLLQLRDERFVVVELGINNFNEMKELVEIAQPDLGLVTNIAPVHLEGLKGLRYIYEEKRLLLDSSREAVFINADDRFLRRYESKVNFYTFGRRGRFSYKNVVIRHIDNMVFTVFDREEPRLTFDVPFHYANVAVPKNVVGAVAVGRYLGIDWSSIVDGIKRVKLPGLRMEVVKIGKCVIFVDAYNANPLSMSQSLETFSLVEGKRKTVVLGDMKELGKFSKLYHKNLAKKLCKYNFENIVLVGEEIEETFKVLKERGFNNVRHMVDVNELKKHFAHYVKRSDLILLKGSRSVALEKVLEGDLNAL